MTRRIAVLLSTVAAVATAACSGSGSDAAPKPTTTVPAAPSSSTSFTIVTVPGNPRTSTTVPPDLSPGEATLLGTVAGPDGPVTDATVRVERLTGDEAVSVDVRAVSGSWQLPSIRGGRYRIRAWRAPDMAMLEPELLFLGSTEAKPISLVLTRFAEMGVTATTDPTPLLIGQTGTLTTQVIAGSVDPQGVVRGNPRPGLAVQLVPGDGLTLEGPDRQVTDAEGNNIWRVRCLAPGSPPAGLLVGTTRYAVSIPACGPG